MTQIPTPAIAETKATAETAAAVVKIPTERSQFRALLAVNPNYFGNISASPLPPVKPLQSNKTYEEIGCVGFHPQAGRLDAVVFVKQPTGYGGDICSHGTQEWVRFYLSYDNGASWVDQGAASFTAHDVPASATHQRQLEYAVGVPCKPAGRFCGVDQVLLARAILSWDLAPPANQPSWQPVWGEVHNTHILVQPLKKLPWYELLNEFKVKLPTALTQVLDLDQEALVKPAAELSVAQMHQLYAGKGVEPHRYAGPAVQKLLAQPVFGTEFTTIPEKGLFADLGIDTVKLISAVLAPQDGNTYYEQLECVGFNPATSELIGVLRVKRPNGYSGGPCSAGSREYVTFWADLDGNGSFETCLGTASVQVFDIARMPADGLEYSVFLPVNFNALRQPCKKGPRIVPIRAVLSWNSVAPCAFPNKPPVWGNHDDTQILLPPGDPVKAGDFSPALFNISTVAVCDINQATGLTTIGDRPFGGAVFIVGDIPGADSLPGPDRIKYRLAVRETSSSTWQPLANDFGVSVDEFSASTLTQTALTQKVDADGWYTWRDYGIGTGTWRRLAAPYVGLLGVWYTGQPMTGTWEIRVEAYDTLDASKTVLGAMTTHCSNGTTRNSVVVALDEIAPQPDIQITQVSTDGGATWSAAAGCGDFPPGCWVRGSYSVSDLHFGSLTITVEPSGPANGATPAHLVAVNPSPTPPTTTPFPRGYPGVSTFGESSEWVLNTAGMQPCGYVIRLDTSDRTIVSASGGWTNHASVGLCLRAPGAAG